MVAKYFSDASSQKYSGNGKQHVVALPNTWEKFSQIRIYLILLCMKSPRHAVDWFFPVFANQQ